VWHLSELKFRRKVYPQSEWKKINEPGTTLVDELLVTSNVPSSLIFSTLMMEMISSSETDFYKSHMVSLPKRWHSSIFEFHEILGNFVLATYRVVARVVLSSTEMVSQEDGRLRTKWLTNIYRN
jgi:hypothetical protein